MQSTATSEARFVKKVCSSWTAYQGFALLTGDLIIEILTWLPAKSLTKYKSVCKLWCTIIKTRKFIEKHMQHAEPSILFINSLSSPPSKKPFEFCYTLDGLILEKNIIEENHGYSRIRNPTTNWHLELPVQVFNMSWMSMMYLPLSEKYKVSSLHREYSSGYVSMHLNVFTIGVDVTWRHGQVSISCGNHRGIVYSITLDGVTYIRRYCTECRLKQIFAFQIEDESLMTIPLPQRVEAFSGTGKQFRSIECYNKFGIWGMLNGDFHIWILQDHTKAEWVERKIVLPSRVFIQYPFIKVTGPYKLTSTGLYIHTGDESQYLFMILNQKKWYGATNL